MFVSGHRQVVRDEDWSWNGDLILNYREITSHEEQEFMTRKLRPANEKPFDLVLTSLWTKQNLCTWKSSIQFMTKSY